MGPVAAAASCKRGRVSAALPHLRPTSWSARGSPSHDGTESVFSLYVSSWWEGVRLGYRPPGIPIVHPPVALALGGPWLARSSPAPFERHLGHSNVRGGQLSVRVHFSFESRQPIHRAASRVGGPFCGSPPCCHPPVGDATATCGPWHFLPWGPSVQCHAHGRGQASAWLALLWWAVAPTAAGFICSF